MASIADEVMQLNNAGFEAFVRVVTALDGHVYREDGIQDDANNAVTMIVDTLIAKGLDKLAALRLIVEGDIAVRGSDSHAGVLDLVVMRPGDDRAIAGYRILK